MVYLNPRLNDEATYQFYNCEWTSIYNETKFNSISDSTKIDDQINLSSLGLIEKARGGIKGKGKLLELGSGNGTFLRAAKKSGFDVYSVELNEGNYQRLKNEFGDNMHNTDLFGANFDPNMFDVIYMRDVFEHVPNPKQLLLEMNRVASKDCIIFIQVPNIEGLIYKLVKEKHVCVFGYEHLNYWSPDTLRKILDLTGFKALKVLHQSLDFRLPYIADYIWGPPSFTSIDQKETSTFNKYIIKIIKIIAGLLPVRYFDFRYLPKFPDLIKRGSVISIIAKKQGNV
jgi:2-polyprenyl-3-methyl-5-hydroxy-6-metoxy-1,4-benzoquinol methylase